MWLQHLLIPILITIGLLYIPELWSYVSFESSPKMIAGVNEPLSLPNRQQHGFERIEVYFECNYNIKCRGWFYQQNNSYHSPTLIFSLGIPFMIEFGVDDEFFQFATNGYNLFAYDPMTFGKSVSKNNSIPNHSLSPYIHIESFSAMINHIKYNMKNEINFNDISIFSASFGSAIAIHSMNKLRNVFKPKSMIMFVPFLGPIPEIDNVLELLLKKPISTIVKAIWGSISDKIRKYLNLKRLYFGFLSERKENYLSVEYLDDYNSSWNEKTKILPDTNKFSCDFRNAFLAESVIDIILGLNQFPVLYEINQQIPMLFIASLHDNDTPIYKINHVFNKTKSINHLNELCVLKCGHMLDYCPKEKEHAYIQTFKYLAMIH